MSQVDNLPKTQHLFLLIGGNPLPNYVAASLLLADKGHLYLVHSQRNDKAIKSGTFEIAKEVCKRLDEKFREEHKDFTPHYISVNEADPDGIYSTVQKAASQIPRRATVGLNYTGGTKVMAVHTYRVLREIATSLGWQTTFSYLDAESMSLYLENSQQRQPIPVREQLLVSIETLTKLHNEMLEDGSPSRVVVLANLANTLAQVLCGDNINELWRIWLSQELCAKASINNCKDDQGWREEEGLSQIELEWPHEWTQKRLQREKKQYSGSLLPLQNALKAYFGQESAPTFSLGSAVENTPADEYLGSCRALCEWLHGFWLEHYVLNCIQRIKTANKVPGLYDFGRSVRTDKTIAHHNFELDIAATVGYQFFAISCTTSTQWGTNKSKLFEAYIRGRQLGGEEARIGFITLSKGATKLQKEVEEQWQASGRIRIFDAKEIADLPSVLINWFNTGGRR